MSPDDTLLATEDDCRCEAKVKILYARAALAQSSAYSVLTIICGTGIIIILMGYVAFLMLSSWYERRTNIDQMTVTCILGSATLMFGCLFGASKKKAIVDSVKKLTAGSDQES